MAAKTIARKTPAELREEVDYLQKEVLSYQRNKATCYLCGKMKDKSTGFYSSGDPMCKSGITRICKECAEKIACPPDAEGNLTEPTKATVMKALEYLDKPFIQKIWDASYYEYYDPEKIKKKKSIWAIYIRNVAMPKYFKLRWRDSDMFKTDINMGKMDAALPSDIEEKVMAKEKTLEEQLQEEYIKNKRDVISQAGYDPFANYANGADKPFLYSSLNNFIDEETKNDGMKMKAVIQIVKTFNQLEKINDAIDNYASNPANFRTNITQLNTLTATADKLIRSANALAKDNGISVNFNNNKSKGANTLSGKIKQLNEIGLRDAKINTFDIETCAGMKQVAELSQEAIRKQIGMDENIAQEIKDIKIDLVETLTKERDEAVEALRILLVENIDLKNFLKDQGLIDENGKIIDKTVEEPLW